MDVGSGNVGEGWGTGLCVEDREVANVGVGGEIGAGTGHGGDGERDRSRIPVENWKLWENFPYRGKFSINLASEFVRVVVLKR